MNRRNNKQNDNDDEDAYCFFVVVGKFMKNTIVTDKTKTTVGRGRNGPAEKSLLQQGGVRNLGCIKTNQE